MEKMKPANIRYLVIHCSATKSNQNYSLEQLERDHRQRGFERGGYHYYIRRDGGIYIMRKHSEVGAHCQGFNRCSLGICYEGGLDSLGRPCDTRSEEQKRSLEHLLRLLRLCYPEVLVVGHRDMSPDRNGDGRISRDEWIKVCPGFEVRDEYGDLTEINKEKL